jgi:hypothetical protein
MLDRLVNGALLLVPSRRSPVKLRDEPRLVARELVPQQVGEQMVIAVPLPPGVQRHDEDVFAVQLPQQPGRVVGAGHCAAQRTGKPVQDRAAQEKLPDVVDLAIQHLRGQVVNDLLVVSGKRLDELLWVFAASH